MFASAKVTADDGQMDGETDMRKFTGAARKFCCKCAKNQASSSVKILVCIYCLNDVVAVLVVVHDDDDDDDNLMVLGKLQISASIKATV